MQRKLVIHRGKVTRSRKTVPSPPFCNVITMADVGETERRTENELSSVPTNSLDFSERVLLQGGLSAELPLDFL